MDNNQTKKMINNKLKLYRNARIGEVAMGLGVLGGTIGTTVLYGNAILNLNINNNIKLLSLLGVTSLASIIGSLILAKNVHYDKNTDIKVLRTLKKELNEGNNRFSDIKEEDFNLEFDNIVKQYVKNKVE